MPIPRIIHTFWQGPKPYVVELCENLMHEKHPGWTIHHVQHVEPTEGIEKLSVQHISDWVRISNMHRQGGVWLDSTCICFDTVEKWVDMGADSVQGFSMPGADDVLENWAFAAPPGHPLIKAWMDEFRVAIRIGFEQYKAKYVLKRHAVYEWMPYLTQHACYVKVVNADGLAPARMTKSCDGPFAYLCRTKGFETTRAVTGLMYDEKPFPLVKMRGSERTDLEERLFLPVHPDTNFARVMHAWTYDPLHVLTCATIVVCATVTLMGCPKSAAVVFVACVFAFGRVASGSDEPRASRDRADARRTRGSWFDRWYTGTPKTLADVCAGRVAVVGNGSIFHEDRAQIERADCVIRFNDMKSMRDGERCDVHVSRFAHGTFSGKWEKRHVHAHSVLPVAVNDEWKDTHLLGENVLETLFVHEPQFGVMNRISPRVHLFEGCRFARTHAETRAGPSTGGAVIDYLQRSPAVVRIDVYGMNWSGSNWHVDFKHPDLVRQCCSKCVIHDPASYTYK